jgi:hypothetical protein
MKPLDPNPNHPNHFPQPFELEGDSFRETIVNLPMDHKNPCDVRKNLFGKGFGRRMDLIDALVLATVGISVVVAMVSPTPMLQDRDIGIDKRVFPSRLGAQSTFALPLANGGAIVENASEYGCLRVKPQQGKLPWEVCNLRLQCRRNSATAAEISSFEIYRLPEPDTFFVTTGSACNSECCDWRGLSLTGNGIRLDDGVLDRIFLRLGAVGIFAMVLGVASYPARRRFGTTKGIRIIGMIGILTATAMLWLNR